VSRLPAEEPERSCVVHRDRHGGDLGRVRGHRHKARVDATGHGFAWCGESRLRRGVVLGHEDKLDSVTHSRGDCLGVIVEAIDAANLDLPTRGEHGSGKSGNGGRSESETHFEGFVLWGVFKR